MRFRTSPVPVVDVEQSVRDRLYGGRNGVVATPNRDGPVGRLVGGRYRLVDHIARGGMATVFRARDERLKRDVAVKLIAERLTGDAASERRFRREAELCARLSHPNVVAVLDAGTKPRDFLVMELVHGYDAGTLVRNGRRSTPGQAVRIVAQVADGLVHAHDSGVLHNDVSPRNVLVRLPDGAAKLADFGLASDAHDVRHEDAGGTLGFMAPEVHLGARPTPRSDLYSLAMLAYWLLAGEPALRSGDPDATGPLATSAFRFPPLAEARPGLSGGLTDAIQQALSHDPDARQESVAEFRAQLVWAHRAPLASVA